MGYCGGDWSAGMDLCGRDAELAFEGGGEVRYVFESYFQICVRYGHA